MADTRRLRGDDSSTSGSTEATTAERMGSLREAYLAGTISDAELGEQLGAVVADGVATISSTDPGENIGDIFAAARQVALLGAEVPEGSVLAERLEQIPDIRAKHDPGTNPTDILDAMRANALLGVGDENTGVIPGSILEQRLNEAGGLEGLLSGQKPSDPAQLPGLPDQQLPGMQTQPDQDVDAGPSAPLPDDGFDSGGGVDAGGGLDDPFGGIGGGGIGDGDSEVGAPNGTTNGGPAPSESPDAGSSPAPEGSAGGSGGTGADGGGTGDATSDGIDMTYSISKATTSDGDIYHMENGKVVEVDNDGTVTVYATSGNQMLGEPERTGTLDGDTITWSDGTTSPYWEGSTGDSDESDSAEADDEEGSQEEGSDTDTTDAPKGEAETDDEEDSAEGYRPADDGSTGGIDVEAGLRQASVNFWSNRTPTNDPDSGTSGGDGTVTGGDDGVTDPLPDGVTSGSEAGPLRIFNRAGPEFGPDGEEGGGDGTLNPDIVNGGLFRQGDALAEGFTTARVGSLSEDLGDDDMGMADEDDAAMFDSDM